LAQHRLYINRRHIRPLDFYQGLSKAHTSQQHEALQVREIKRNSSK
jgi:hypothetical protein